MQIKKQTQLLKVSKETEQKEQEQNTEIEKLIVAEKKLKMHAEIETEKGIRKMMSQSKEQ